MIFRFLRVGQLDQFLGLLGGGGERLFDEHVLAVFEGGFGELVVRPHRSDDGDGVDLGRFENFLGIGRHFEAGIVLLGSRQRARIHVAKHFDARVVHSEKVPNHVRTPVPVTDYADSDHLRFCTIGMAVGMTIGMTVGIAVLAHKFSRPFPESRCPAPRWMEYALRSIPVLRFGGIQDI